MHFLSLSHTLMQRPCKYEFASMLCLNQHVYYFDAGKEELKKETERKGRKKRKKKLEQKKTKWSLRREGKEGGGEIQRFLVIHHKLYTM